MYLILELIGYDENNKVEFVLGERQSSLFQMIQKQVREERDA
jgi:hypothetical protein